jgi:hypothetical protein
LRQKHQQSPAALLLLQLKEREPVKEDRPESIVDWPNVAIPAVAAGAYVVWCGDELIYAGMSGKDIEKNRHKRLYGLFKAKLDTTNPVTHVTFLALLSGYVG